MDLVTILLFCLISIVIGGVLMLLLQYYAFVRYFNFPEESAEQRMVNEKYSLPEDILAGIKSADPESKYPITALNLIMQFLFHELKNSNKVRKWFYRKLSLELDELISKTTTGKLFDKLTIRDLDLGGQFPEIRNLRVHNADLHDTEGHIENLDLLLDLQYKGNFRVSIDADMVLGKKGSLTLKVRNLSGLARLQFTRKPYTHWSLSFLGDPQLDLGIESQFQGRQMQSNVTSLILNQIRKAVRRKHTLPNYKLRYKPFFHKMEDDADSSEIIPNGKLDIKTTELSRLMIPNSNNVRNTNFNTNISSNYNSNAINGGGGGIGGNSITDVYCTLTLASLPWVEARQNDDRNVIISIDVEIHKAKNQQIGIVFKQEENSIQVEAVLPNTPAIKANLRSGDTLISIEGKRVNTINQVAKIIKNLNRPVFTLRIERVLPGLIKNDAILDDLDLYEDLDDVTGGGSANSSFTYTGMQYNSSSDTTKMIVSTSRKSSSEKGTSSESSLSNTPTNSPRKQFSAGTVGRQIGKLNKEASNENALPDEFSSATSTGTNRPSSAPTSMGRSKEAHQTVTNTKDKIEHFQQHSTVYCPFNSLIRVEDWCTFKLDEKSAFLNVCVYGKTYNNDNHLLGYINVPVNSVLAECTETNLGHLLKVYYLNPPSTPELQNHVLSMQSGFDPNLCFGDILLSFVWTGGTTLPPMTENSTKKFKQTRGSNDKLEETDKLDAGNMKAHNFIRTHFHRSTQCDFCGKKIWLKDAVQCRDCSMCCHKKCITKCQNSTVCGPVDCLNVNPGSSSNNSSPQISAQPEFTVTEANVDFNTEEGDEAGHKQTFGDLLVQGLKRVNSANNLSIPGVGSSVGQGSRSLPPSPQHTPRKQSLVNQSVNPFVTVTQRLEDIPTNITDLTKEQISNLVEPLLNSTNDDAMSLAKSSSKHLYADFEPNLRVEKINDLLSKLRIALDSETAAHALLVAGNMSTDAPAAGGNKPKTTNLSSNNDSLIQNNSAVSSPTSTNQLAKVTDGVRPSPDINLFLQTKPPLQSSISTVANPTKSLTGTTSDRGAGPVNEHEMAKRALLIGQCEERIKALSVIMLYLCTGLQHAQGVAGQ